MISIAAGAFLLLQRRTVAEKALNATGHAGVDEATLFSVLSTPPVLNAGVLPLNDFIGEKARARVMHTRPLMQTQCIRQLLRLQRGHTTCGCAMRIGSVSASMLSVQ